jgi:Tol biopolymer transport system component
VNAISKGQLPAAALMGASLAAMLFIQGCGDPSGPHRPATAITYVETSGSDSRALVVVSGDGREVLARYPLPYAVDEAQLSPDQGAILLWSTGNASVAVMSVGDGVTTTIASEAGIGMPEWSADGQRILFYSSQNGGSAWVMDRDGTNAGPVAAGVPPIPLQYDPSWSPDGSRIVFNSPYDSSGTAWRTWMYVMNADGTDIHRLPLDSAVVPGDAVEPSWSPDGSRIAFEAEFNGGYGIVVANADGSGARRLTSGGSIQRSPWWSPDGTQIVYVETAGPHNYWRPFVIDLATGSVRQLTSDVTSVVSDWNPHWMTWR